MVIIALDHLQEVDHIPLSVIFIVAFSDICNGVNEVLKVLPVAHFALFQLLSDGTENCILMCGITEDGTVVFLKLTFQFPDEIKVGEVMFLGVEILPAMGDGTVLFDNMVRELKCHLLVRVHALV